MTGEIMAKRVPSIKNPEQYIGRFAWSRRQGRVRVVSHISGRIFEVEGIDRHPGVHFEGGLGTTYKLLK